MRIILLFISSFLSSAELSELLNKNQKFSSNILISDIDTEISSGFLSYKNGNYKYSIQSPSSQVMAEIDGQLFIQDDDFKQVIRYIDNNSFLIKKLLSNTYEHAELSCNLKCFRLLVNDERISNAIIVFENEFLHEIHVENFQNNKFLIKFENFVLESTNITYVTPDGYELITND